MTPETYSVLRDIVLFLILPALIFYAGRDRKQVADAIEQRFVAFKAAVAASFELRDQRLNAIDKRIDAGAERFSKEGGRITERMEDFRDRLVRLEAHAGGRRANDEEG